MKEKVLALGRKMAVVPVLGSAVRAAARFYRRRKVRATQESVISDKQLEALLANVTEINRRQVEMMRDKDNIVHTVPSTLRKLVRDMREIQDRVGPRVLGGKDELDEVKARVVGITESVEFLLKRVEFVRKELLFEIRYGAHSREIKEGREKKFGLVVNPEKLETMRASGIRLNIGCGHIPMPEYINVDRRSLPGVDVVADIESLPFDEGEVEEVYSAHFLEHFPQEELRRSILPRLIRILRPGGRFRAIVPDSESMIKAYAAEKFPYEALREVTFGGQDYDGDFHFNMFTIKQLESLLIEAGLEGYTVVEKGRKNGSCLEMEVEAKKRQ